MIHNKHWTEVSWLFLFTFQIMSNPIEQWIFQFREDGLLEFESITLAPNHEMNIVHKETVAGIIKHREKDEYLLLSRPTWQKWFLWWWVEQWETPLQAMQRELMEEVWYTDFSVIDQIWNPIFSHFQHPSKNINLLAKTYFFFIQLHSAERVKVSEEELQKHSELRVEKSAFDQTCTAPIWKLLWNRYIHWYLGSKECTSLDKLYISDYHSSFH